VKQRKGISVILEAMLVSVIVVSSFTISYFYLTPSNPRLQRSKPNLNTLAYDVMNSLASSGGFDKTILDSLGNQVTNWPQTLKISVYSLLPGNYIFSINVSQIQQGSSTIPNAPLPPVTFTNLNAVPISNASPSAFKNVAQVAEVSFLYTTPSLFVLLFNFRLATVTSP
jgi:hypothetical protein